MRITSKTLESLVDSINILTKSPTTPYSPKKDNGGCRANINNYHIGYSYNSVSLQRMCTDGGGVSSIYGPCNNRELYCFMIGYIRGFTDGKNSRIRRRKKPTVEKI